MTQAEPTDSGEVDRLATVMDEVQGLLTEDEQALAIVEADLSAVHAEMERAEAQLRSKTDAYVAPLFEDISTLSSSIAKADADEQRLQLVLGQWKERARIQKESEELDVRIGRIKRELDEEKARLESHRAYVGEFSDTFDEIVRELELAWYTTASVDLHNYLPIVGEGDYESLSGGQRTVVSVAYHLALLTVGLVHPTDLSIPSLLILDTPSKYLGSKDSAQVTRDYRRIAAIVDAYASPVQILVADNDAPPQGVRPSNTIELSYQAPLVPGLDHPGGDAVKSIHDEYGEDD